MLNFRNIFSLLAIMALFALSTAPPGYAFSGNADNVYLNDLINNDTGLTIVADPYDGDITALVTSASGMKSDFAARNMENNLITLTAKTATKGGDATASGTKTSYHPII